MDLAANWMDSLHNFELIVDLLGFLILFLLIFLFNKSKQRVPKQAVENSRLLNFIASKKIVSVMLFGVLGVMLLSTLSQWIYNVFNQQSILNLDGLQEPPYHHTKPI